MIVAMIVAVVLGLTAFFASRLKEIISRPISNLVDVAQEISTTQNYNLHADKESADEIGNLVDAFNSMLSQIAQSTKALQKSENRFRTFINQAADAFFLHDMNGRIVDVNKRACDS
ncbi:HAMP domain-containing protein, partial [Thermodesulfobacteriota bacterium]